MRFYTSSSRAACLIELLSEVLDAEQSLFGKKVRPVDDWLLRYLKVCDNHMTKFSILAHTILGQDPKQVFNTLNLVCEDACTYMHACVCYTFSYIAIPKGTQGTKRILYVGSLIPL